CLPLLYHRSIRELSLFILLSGRVLWRLLFASLSIRLGVVINTDRHGTRQIRAAGRLHLQVHCSQLSGTRQTCVRVGVARGRALSHSCTFSHSHFPTF